MSGWYIDEKNPNLVWISVECPRCGSQDRTGTFYNQNHGPYPDPMPSAAELDKKMKKIQKTWVCCPGPPLWWERIKRWWKNLIGN